MQKNICYVPKWGGAQKGDFPAELLCFVTQMLADALYKKVTGVMTWK